MEQLIAALDLGTSKMIAMVARKQYGGGLSILHTEKEKPENNNIKRGYIHNINVTSAKISGLIRKLNFKLKENSLEKIYVGIGGQSLRTEQFCVKKPVEGGVVTKEIIDGLKAEADFYVPEFAKTLKVLEPEYYLDGALETHPEGINASEIEVRFLLIVGMSTLQKLVEKVILDSKINAADFFISPLATAEAVLTKEEKELGCALVEWGAGITYVSVYKGGALKYLITIPIGGSAISKDIRSLNVSEEEAEKLKSEYGSAILNPNENRTIKIAENTDSPREVKIANLNEIIEARADEIIANIIAQIG
ncbi:MAG: cell division protein FtsA, partial [Candidatus Symbiothrix sp.]|nr:cell division protein FtsA [Candidatus Symbiothrix sp.]